MIDADVKFIITIVTFIGCVFAIIKFLLDVKSELGDMKVEIAKMQLRYEYLEQSVDKRISDLEQRVDKRISDLEQRVDQRIGKLEQRFDKYDGIHTDIETNIIELRSQSLEQKNQTVEQASQIAGLKEHSVEQISEVKTIVEKQETRLQKVETETYSTLKEMLSQFMNSTKKAAL